MSKFCGPSTFQAAGILIPTTTQDGDGIKSDKIISLTTVRCTEADSECLILIKMTNL
jgi:hypothetical protein